MCATFPWILDEARGHHFCPKYLDRGGICVDLGANDGSFSHWLASKYGMHCIAVEPVPGNYESIPESKGIARILAAVGPCNGRMRFNVATTSEGGSLRAIPSDQFARPIEVEVTTLSDLLAKHEVAVVDLLKMDIEGSEIDVLGNASDSALGRIKQITVEFHDFMGTVTSAEVGKASRRLVNLGFHRVCMTWFTNGDVLFVNKRLCRVTKRDLLSFALQKYCEGSGRLLRRQVRRILDRLRIS